MRTIPDDDRFQSYRLLAALVAVEDSGCKDGQVAAAVTLTRQVQRSALEFGERIVEESDKSLEVDCRLLSPRNLLTILGIGAADADGLIELRGIAGRSALTERRRRLQTLSS